MSSPGVIKGYPEPRRRPSHSQRHALVFKTMVILYRLPENTWGFIILFLIGLKDIFHRAIAGHYMPNLTALYEDNRVRRDRGQRAQKTALVTDGEGISRNADKYKTDKKKPRKKSKNKSMIKVQGKGTANVDIPKANPDASSSTFYEIKPNDGTLSSHSVIEVKASDDTVQNQETTTEGGHIREPAAAVDNDEGWVEVKSKATTIQAKKLICDNTSLSRRKNSVLDITRTLETAAHRPQKTPELKSQQTVVTDRTHKAKIPSLHPAHSIPNPHWPKPLAVQAEVDALSDSHVSDKERSREESWKRDQAQLDSAEIASFNLASTENNDEQDEIEWKFSVDEKDSMSNEAFKHKPVKDDGKIAEKAECQHLDKASKIKHHTVPIIIATSSGSSKKGFTEIQKETEAELYMTTELSTKVNEVSEDTEKHVDEQNWTEVSSAKKRNQKVPPNWIPTTLAYHSTSQSKIGNMPVLEPSSSLRPERSPEGSRQKSRKPSVGDLSIKAIPSPSKLRSRVQIESAPVTRHNSPWDITKTSSWRRTSTIATVDNEVQTEYTVKSSSSLNNAQRVSSTLPTNSAPSTDYETESLVFSSNSEQAASSVASDPEITVSEDEEVQEKSIVWAESKGKDQTLPADGESPSPPTSPKHKFLSRSSPSTLQREVRWSPAALPDIFGEMTSVKSSSDSLSRQESDTPATENQKHCHSIAGSLTASDIVSNEVENAKGSALSGTDKTTTTQNKGPSAEVHEGVDENMSIVGEASAGSIRDQINTSTKHVKARVPYAATPEAQKAKATSSKVPEVNISVKEVKTVQETMTAQRLEVADTTAIPKYKPKVLQPWRGAVNDTSLPIISNDSFSSGTISSDWRVPMVVLGHPNLKRIKDDENRVPAAPSPLVQAAPAWTPKESNWKPKNGKLWSDEDDEDESLVDPPGLN